MQLDTRLGTVYDYNNGNTIMLAYFVEKFSGMKLEEYMRQKIFAPLGMTGTSQDNLAQQLKAQPNQVSNYYDYTDLIRSYDYFAY